MSRQLEKILIVDDSEMNRAILTDILGEEYEILEAENGVQAVEILEQQHKELSLVLLDLVMPEMDGMEVLSVMNEHHWLDDLPVILISAESGTEYVHQAYELGATDYIVRPFDAVVVQHRTVNTINLYARQRKIEEMMTDVFEKKAAHNRVMEENFKRVLEARELNRSVIKVVQDEAVKSTLEQVDQILEKVATL